MNQAALFCDGTESYVIPAEPEAGSRVTLRFRTAKDDSVQVFLLTRGESLLWKKSVRNGDSTIIRSGVSWEMNRSATAL